MNFPPLLNFSTTTNFSAVWSDKKSNATMHGAFYRPVPQDGYFILGDYGQGNYNPPNGTVWTIGVAQDDDPDHPALKPPSSYALVYEDKHSGAKENGSFWAPIPPPGYVACGHVIQSGYVMPSSVPNLRCLRSDLAKSVIIADYLIWNNAPLFRAGMVSIYRNRFLNTIYAVASYETPSETSYAPSTMRPPEKLQVEQGTEGA